MASQRASISVLVSQREPSICREEPGIRAVTGHGVALAAGMADVNWGGHADTWQGLGGGGAVREAAAVGHTQTHSPVPCGGTEPLFHQPIS